MITLPFSCKEAKICIYLTGIGLLFTIMIHGILFDESITFIIGVSCLGGIGLVSLMWYAYDVEKFFKRHVRCRCE